MSSEISVPYRVAIYFAPDPESAWGLAGSEWLGRCAARHVAVAQPVSPGQDAATWSRLTAEPRRYGWHATLKPPFQLARGHTLDGLRQALRNLAGSWPAFDLPPMQVSLLSDFLALQPQSRDARLHDLAAACVTQLHPFAQPLDDAMLQRRRQVPLSPEHDALLRRWGYPWVLQAFRFHFSLTGPLRDVGHDIREALRQAAQAKFSALPPCRFDRLSLFAEPEPGADFVLIEQQALQG